MSAECKTGSVQCEFGSLAENRCPDDATWKTSFDSFFCDKHKPPVIFCVRLESAPDLSIDSLGSDLQRQGHDLAVNQKKNRPTVHRKPVNPHWARSRHTGVLPL